jgi:hypothetical protein
MFIATSLSRNANNLHESAVPRNGHDGKPDHEIREAMGDKFQKHIFHSIICIGALVGRRDTMPIGKWVPWAHLTLGRGRKRN